MNEKLYAVLKEFGFPTTLVVVGLLFYTGTFASPITENKALLEAHRNETEKLVSEVRKLVRLQSVMCMRVAKAEECWAALTSDKQLDEGR